MKILRRFGKDDEMVDSASLLVVMYRRGSIGAPAAAEMNTKEGTFSATASCASVIATQDLVSIISPECYSFNNKYPNPCSLAHRSAGRPSLAAATPLPPSSLEGSGSLVS